MLRATAFSALITIPLSLAACKYDVLTGFGDPSDPATAEPLSVLEFSAATSGAGADEFLYFLELSGYSQPIPLFPDSVVQLSTWLWSAQLLGIPSHCAAAKNPMLFTPVENDTVEVRFQVACNGSAPPVAAVLQLFSPLGLIGFDAAGGSARVLASGLHPAWSPDGSRLAFLGYEGGDLRLMVLDASTGSTNAAGSAFDWRSPPKGIAWAADGEYVAIPADEFIRIQPANGGPATVLSPGLGSLTEVAWSPASDSLVVTGYFGVALIAVGGAGQEPVLISDRRSTRSPGWSPAGGAITFIGDDNALFLPDGTLSSGANHDSLFIAPTDGSEPALVAADARVHAWSPDGSLIAFASASAIVHVVSPSGDQPLRTYDMPGHPSWTADGRLRIVGDAIYTVPLDGAPVASTGRGSFLTLMGSDAIWR